MIVKPRKPTGQPSFPQVPHFHTCRGCVDRHKWECRDRHCVWALLLHCDIAAAGAEATEAAAREYFNTDA